MADMLSTYALQQAVAERWPGRHAEVAKLFALLGPCAHHVPDLFVYGLPSTGKTSVVRDCIGALGRRHAYVQCTESMKPKQLLSSIYTQLHGYKRKAGEGYAGLAMDCMVSFIKELPSICRPHERTALIVLDDAHWLARSPMLRQLLECREHSGGASVAFILISQQAWGCGEFEELCVMPTVHFAGYTADQMTATLAKMRCFDSSGSGSGSSCVPEQVRRMFCDIVVSAFRDMTQDLVDLSTLASHLWPCYVEPIASGKVQPAQLNAEQLARKLYSAFVPHLQAVRRLYEPGMRVLPAVPGSGRDGVLRGEVGPALTTQQRQQLLELPVMTKMLVVAAYIASHNKPTVDKQIFDVKARSSRIRRRGGANMDSDRQVEAAKEARLKGPHSFPLQRLLMCLSYLQSGRDVAEVEVTASGGMGMIAGRGAGAAAAAVVQGRPGGGELEEEEEVEEGGSRGVGSRRGKARSGEGAGSAAAGVVVVVDGDALLGRVAPWWRRRQLASELGTQGQAQLGQQGQGQEALGEQWQQQQGRQQGLQLGGSTCECADVLVHLATLATMQLLSRAESELADPLDSAKYTCHISEEYASSMAESLGLRLADYVKYV